MFTLHVRLRYFSFASILSLISFLSLASELPLDSPPPPLDGAIRLGPFQFHPFFRIEDFGYDSNVFLESSGNRSSDLTGRFTAGITGRINKSDRIVFSWEVRPDYTVFLRTPSQNFPGNHVRGRADFFFARGSIFAAANRDSSQQRAGSEIDERTRIRTSLYSGGLSIEAGSRFTIATAVDLTRIQYTDRDFFVSPGAAVFESECASAGDSAGSMGLVLGDVLDRTERGLSLRASYRRVFRVRPFFELEHRQFEFSRCPIRSTRQRGWNLGLQFAPKRAFSGTVQAGSSVFDPDDDRRPNYRGISGKAEVAWQPSEAWKFKSSWNRRADFSIVAQNLYAITTQWSGSVSRAFNPRFALEAGVETSRVTWPEPYCVDNPTSPCSAPTVRRDRIVQEFVGARFHLSNRTDFSIRLALRTRRSNAANQDDSQTTVLTGGGLP